MIPEKSASVISLVFNPAVIAAFTFLILLYPLQNIQTFLLLMATCITFGTMVPLVMMYQLTKLGLISDFDVSERQERTRPLVGAAASYFVGQWRVIVVESSNHNRRIDALLRLQHGHNDAHYA